MIMVGRLKAVQLQFVSYFNFEKWSIFTFLPSCCAERLIARRPERLLIRRASAMMIKLNGGCESCFSFSLLKEDAHNICSYYMYSVCTQM